MPRGVVVVAEVAEPVAQAQPRHGRLAQAPVHRGLEDHVVGDQVFGAVSSVDLQVLLLELERRSIVADQEDTQDERLPRP